MSKYSQISRRTAGQQHKDVQAAVQQVNPIPEEANDWVDDEDEKRQSHFSTYNDYMQNLTEDEQKIMASIINDAIQARTTQNTFVNQDQGMDNTIKNSAKETKGVFFPSNKKLYETSMHQNSEEFKQLGTIHMENRAAEYYPLEKPQPVSYQQNPLADIQMDKLMSVPNGGERSRVRRG